MFGTVLMAAILENGSFLGFAVNLRKTLSIFLHWKVFHTQVHCQKSILKEVYTDLITGPGLTCLHQVGYQVHARKAKKILSYFHNDLAIFL